MQGNDASSVEDEESLFVRFVTARAEVSMSQFKVWRGRNVPLEYVEGLLYSTLDFSFQLLKYIKNLVNTINVTISELWDRRYYTLATFINITYFQTPFLWKYNTTVIRPVIQSSRQSLASTT